MKEILKEESLKDIIKDVEEGVMDAGKTRKLTGFQDTLVYFLCVIISLFHIWVNTMGVITTIFQNALHMASMLMLVFLIYPARKNSPRDSFSVGDLILSILSLLVGLYILRYFYVVHFEQFSVPVFRDVFFGTLTLILLIEGARRTSGLLIPILAIIFSLYTLWFGKFIPGAFFFRGTTFQRFVYRMYLTDEGLFGIVANISSTYVFLFILFGAFLVKSGAGEFVINLAQAVAGRIAGGPAQVAVLSSGLMGSISGSAVANTVSTGSLTIPLMKKMGFQPHVAGAIEAAASTGGQLMPPIMGAGAFIMAQWTGLPYLTIIGVAFIPALMYFLSVGFFVYVTAKKEGITGLKTGEIPPLKEVFKTGGHFMIPIILLITVLAMGRTPLYAAAMGILSVVITSWFRKETRMGIWDILDALALGARNAVTTAIILITAGIIIGVAGITAVGITFSGLILALSQGYVFLAIVLVAIASLILGMGLPVTASYIMLAILAGPALTQLGIPLIAAHMIIFWYSQDANVTPPICLAAYSAAGVAGADPMKTGFKAWRLAKGLYLIPILFAYTPILFTGSRMEAIGTAFLGLMGLFAFTVTVEGFFLRKNRYFETILWGISALTLLLPYSYTWILGAILFLLLSFLQMYQKPDEGMVAV